MAIHALKNFILAYDIADPDRLRRVHRVVRRRGIPLQYSVFLIPATSVTLSALLGDLDNIIDQRADDIRVYPLPARLEMTSMGRQEALPQGVELLDASASGQQLQQIVRGFGAT